VLPLFADHLAADSIQRIEELGNTPRSTSNPEFSDGYPSCGKSAFRVMILSAIN
jgi:hypothetical protein